MQRLVYFLVFNIACALSDIYYDDSSEREVTGIAVVEENARKINSITKQIFKKYTDSDYKRKPLGTKMGPMGKARAEVGKEMQIELAAAQAGISEDWAKRKQKCWGGLMFTIFLFFMFFVGKNQFLPFVRRRLGRDLPVLGEDMEI